MAAATSPWKTSPWGAASADADVSEPIVSFAEIMSEELAAKLQCEEETGYVDEIASPSSVADADLPLTLSSPDADCSDDMLMARLLQHEFDKEHDEMLRRTEAKYNGNDKVSVSFGKYLHTHPLEESSSSEEDEELREMMTHKGYNKGNPDFGASGFVRDADGKIITKHDKDVCGRKNTAKALQFPPDFPMGDACDIKLNNQVYNVLKKHSQTEQKRHQRVKDKEEKATAEMSMDANTRLILFKMVNNGLLESVGGAIATGKESVVFHALGGEIQENGKVVPTECAIKVFKTVLSEFKNRSEYVKDDFRFKNPRKVLRVWAEKEFLNLNRMNRVGIRCPQVVKLKKHVLVLSFIGQDGHPAPKLKDVVFNDQESKLAAFNDCQELMVRLYRECRLVHADLSEFNLLYWDSKCWMIDVSQAVDLSHPKSLVFLARDCQNIVDYFACAGLDEVPTVRELFNRITDMNIESSDDDFLLQVQQFALQNRPVQFKADKAKPAAAELRKYYEYKGEQNSRDASPAREYH